MRSIGASIFKNNVPTAVAAGRGRNHWREQQQWPQQREQEHKHEQDSECNSGKKVLPPEEWIEIAGSSWEAWRDVAAKGRGGASSERLWSSLIQVV